MSSLIKAHEKSKRIIHQDSEALLCIHNAAQTWGSVTVDYCTLSFVLQIQWGFPFDIVCNADLLTYLFAVLQYISKEH